MSRACLLLWLGAASLVGLPTTALARTDFQDLPVVDARDSERGRAKLLGVPYYMAGQSHREVLKSFGTFTSNRRVNGFGRGDEAACQSAFLSALISLQKRAQSLGANAIIDIRSVTRDNTLSSPSHYRCAAGFAVSNVALEGRIVKLAR